MLKFGIGKGPIKKKRAVVIASSCAAVVLVAVLTVFLYINGMLGKINYASATSAVSTDSSDADLTTSSNAPQSTIEDIDSQIRANLANSSIPLAYDENVFNVLLIGCDARTNSDTGLSDSMIILSINKKTQKIVMTSVMRDMYVAIPGYGSNRINAAYAFGGSKLLLDTIQANFKIKIDKYMCVNFFSFIDIVDKLGGVNARVSEAEMKDLNKNVEEINAIKGLPPSDGFLAQAGDDLHLTGKQTLGYVRIRHVGNADFERTERQRMVLTQIFDKLRGQNVIQLNSLLGTLLPEITTNLSKGEFFSLLLSAPAYSNYTLVEDRLPIDGSFQNVVINQMDVLSVDLTKNIANLRSEIFNETD
ncbi:MAG: LCP family protein [Clostridia bacterium]|nr:LCP family protein [Clostridia bacterium]